MKYKTRPIVNTDVTKSRRSHINPVTRGHLTCKSNDVIDLIRCKHGYDNARYVGETS